MSNPDLNLESVRDIFIRSSVHQSPKTISTLSERLRPFTAYLIGMGIHDPLRITREHVDGFLIEIAKGRRGKPLSPASVFGFTKDVQAFINYVADEIAPEDWRNPVRRLKLKHPQVAIHPLSYGQIASLLEVANHLAPTPELKARSRAMLYVLPDGALRISELMNAMKHHLGEEGMLRVYGKGAKSERWL